VQPLARIRHLDISEHPEWGGAKLRMMLQCIYTIAFLCLLRFDEVLRIHMKDIEVIDKVKGHIKLVLPFRKTHQYGGISVLLALIYKSQRSNPFICSSIDRNCI
jgi:hypothetical protein